MTKFQRMLAERNGTLDAMYATEVRSRIRTRYSFADELAVLRQRDEKPEEFAAYNAYAETCKAEARAKIYGEEDAQ